MASLVTPSLCRVGGEEVYHRLDQPGNSVLPRLYIDPDAVPPGGVGGNGTDAGYPAPPQQPHGLLHAEGPDEVLDRRAGGGGHAGGPPRSEERPVGEEGRSRGAPDP